MKKYFLLYFILLLSISLSQEYSYKGEFKQGSVVIFEAKNLSKVFYDNKEVKFSNDHFIIGFDRDDKGKHSIRMVFLNGKEVTKNIEIEKRKYKIQRINNLKKKYVSPPKREMKRINKERKLKKEARAKVGKITEPFFLSGFVRPVKGGRISGVFGSQRILNGVPKSPHNGVDIAAPRGTKVRAMADGKVIFAANNFYFSGNYLLIDHGLGLNSLYLHLNKMYVKAGDFVKKGQLIGEVGSTGRATGPHLHWSVQYFNKRIDPLSVLKLNVN